MQNTIIKVENLLQPESYKLREFIKTIRACKTIAEEKSLINKERGKIRQFFNENNEVYRLRNIAKLIYINLLGFETDFGQMESLKLIASQHYPEKRIGYFALAQLFNEKSEVLVLATNQLKLDLESHDEYNQSIALVSLSEICTSYMCRELASYVSNLLQKGSIYIKKKAALAATRIVKKVPEIIEEFKQHCYNLLLEGNHGILLGAISLAQDIYEIDKTFKKELIKTIPPLQKTLKNLISTFNQDYESNGISDPFLQVAILKFFRILAMEDVALSNEISDILANVATNTNLQKGAGASVLFECVITIMAVQSGQALRALAIDVLGKFLQNKDSNSKYVSLFVLKQVVNKELLPVQKNKSMILSCLNENDISIKTIALDLIYFISDYKNVQEIIEEILKQLNIRKEDGRSPHPDEFLQELTNKACQIIENYSETKQWQLESTIKIMLAAGNHINETNVSSLINLIIANPEIQQQAIQLIIDQLKQVMMNENLCPNGLFEVGLWILGEFAYVILQQNQININELLHLIQQILNKKSITETIKEYASTAVIKICKKSSYDFPEIKDILKKFSQNQDLELQQRSCEYLQILEPMWDKERSLILQQMPAFSQVELKKKKEVKANNQNENLLDIVNESPKNNQQKQKFNGQEDDNNIINNLLDFGNNENLPQSQENLQQSKENLQKSKENLQKSNENLQKSNENLQKSNENLQKSNENQSNAFDLMEMDDNQQLQQQQLYIHQVYEDTSIKLYFECSNDSQNPSISYIKAVFQSKIEQQILDINLQVAVLKYLKLTMSQISSTHIDKQEEKAHQLLTIENSLFQQKGIQLKIKLQYIVNSQQFNAEKVITDLPEKFQ